MKEKILTVLTLFALALVALSCKKEPPPAVQVPALELVAEDASCTEAWLRIRSVQVPATVRLLRDGQTVSELRLLPGPLGTSDSLLIDEGLLPRRTYSYKAQLLEPQTPNLITSTPDVQVTTMDTTSHNFIFQIDTLGDGSSSVLYDVAIINDTLAYACGAVYKRDSLGNWDPNAYNLVKWNGNTWELMRIQFYTFCGQSGTGSYPAKAIFAFSPTDIWIGMDGSQVVRWNGQTQSAPMCTPVSINKLWGEGPGSVYAVGNGGGIAHYNGSTWRRIESGTRQYLQDVYGSVNQQNGDRTVLCAASHPLGYGEKKIFSINQSNTVDTLPWPSQRVVMSVWISKASTFYTCGEGVFRRSIDQQWKEIAGANVIPTFTERVRGRADNDIFVVGDFGVVAHFNGVNFRLYPETAAARVYKSLDFKGNQMVAVGYTSSRGIVVRGVRN